MMSAKHNGNARPKRAIKTPRQKVKVLPPPPAKKFAASGKYVVRAKFLDFIKRSSPARREKLADTLGISVGYLKQLAYGIRDPEASLAVKIEQATAGLVTVEMMCPELDWMWAYLMQRKHPGDRVRRAAPARRSK